MGAHRALQTTRVKEVRMQYVPSQVDLSYLKGNQKLYSEDEIERIKGLHLRNGRIKKTNLQKHGIDGAKWDVIKAGENYYAIYRGKATGHLSTETDGFTKLAQNLETGEFFELKIITDDPGQKFQREEKRLRASGRQVVFSKLRFKTPESEEAQHEILTDLVPGIELSSFVSSQRTMSTVRWLDLCITTAESIDKLHQQKMIHGNLNIENCMLDPASHRVSLVNLRSAVFLEKDKQQVHASPQTQQLENPYYKAPECTRGMLSDKTDVFSFGIMLAEMLNLGCKSGERDFNMFDPSNLPKGVAEKINPLTVRREVSKFIEKMLSQKPEDRPSMQDTMTFLKNVRRKYMETPGLLTRVAYLNIEDYVNASNNARQQMISALKDKDEVFFLDINEKNKESYLSIREELEEEGIIVMSNVIQCGDNNIKDILSQHMEQRDLTAQLYLYDCSYVHKTTVQGENLTPSKELVDRIVLKLKDEIDRLESEPAVSSNQKINKQIEAIKASQKMILDLGTTGRASYVTLQKELDQLQNELLSKNMFKRFFERFGTTATHSFRVAKQLAVDVEKEAQTHIKPKK